MRELLHRLRMPLVLGALLLTTTVTMLSDQRAATIASEDAGWTGVFLDVAAPLQKTLEVPIDWAREGVRRYVALVDLQEENARLRAWIAELEEENLQFREALVASGRLRRIVELRDRFETPMRPAEIVGQDVSPWFRSVLLDRGRRQDVRSGMPVVTDQGLVGLVTASASRASRAMLILDRKSSVDAVVQRSRARGIVRGTGSARPEFGFVVRGDDVREGDVVITSGVGGLYPKGLRIGTVRQVEIGEDRLLHMATVEPAVDFAKLEQVFVLLQRGPIMELLDPADPASPSGELALREATP